MPRREIVKRGLIEGSIPMYGVAGAALAAPYLLGQGRQDSGSSTGPPAGAYRRLSGTRA